VRENVAFGLVERRVPKSEAAGRVTAALAKVGLEGYGERMPAQLSGGQQQRVVLARALVLNPRVVLLDEPLSNLDAKLRAEMREEIERLHRETDITFVYVTHDQTEALSLADRMAVMQAGRISAVGAPRELYHRPPNTFCAGFLGEANMIAGRVAAVEGGAVRVETPFGVWRAIFGGSRLPAVGERIECMVRPENLRAAPTADANMLDAVVKSTRMNGATVTVVLEAAGLSLKATVLNQPSLDLQPGASGRWFLDASHTVTLLRE
jgi:ABC-type Fe3+/spermidine/putrescine transport system ATPase subunit